MRGAVIAALTGAILVAGCTSFGSRDATKVASTPTGVVTGGLLGTRVSSVISEADRQTASEAEYRALEYGRAGQPVQWRSRSGDTHGEVSVGPGYEVNRLDCREYTHTVYVGGRAQVDRGTACREPSGTWRMVS